MDSRLLAEYTRSAAAKDRNLVGLVIWAAGIVAQPIPATRPSDDWVRARLLAERVPQTPDYYVTRTLAYFLQDSATQSDVRLLLNPWNAPSEEDLLASQVAAVITAFMPRFASTEIADPQVTQWLADHGFTGS